MLPDLLTILSSLSFLTLFLLTNFSPSYESHLLICEPRNLDWLMGLVAFPRLSTRFSCKPSFRHTFKLPLNQSTLLSFLLSLIRASLE